MYQPGSFPTKPQRAQRKIQAINFVPLAPSWENNNFKDDRLHKNLQEDLFFRSFLR